MPECPYCNRELSKDGYRDSYLTFDSEARRVYIEGEEVILTEIELALFHCLVSNRHKIIKFGVIIDSVWGWDYPSTGMENLRVVIYHLRKKIEPEPKKPRYIKTRLGIGYYFEGG